jgi:hypothetical protein
MPGDLVWSLGARGERVLVPVQRTARKLLRGAVPMLRIRLESGSELVASGAHPTLGGGLLADLRARDRLGGGWVQSVSLRYLRLDATYDLLPASHRRGRADGARWRARCVSGCGRVRTPLTARPRARTHAAVRPPAGGAAPARIAILTAAPQ